MYQFRLNTKNQKEQENDFDYTHLNWKFVLIATIIWLLANTTCWILIVHSFISTIL
jgi:hypothetical protein